MECLEWLSKAELTRRLQEIDDATAHLKMNLPPGNPHHRLLRVRDIAGYIGVNVGHLRTCAMKGYSKFPERIQRDLSRFFWGFDRGHLVKSCLNGEWKIVSRYASDPSLAQVDAAQGQTRAPLELRIDVTTFGPRLRGR